ncbi:MAG: DEAD/DEAH box helicase [Gemmatimonadota bacterium]
MIVLHALWARGILAVWGEDSARAPRPSRGRHRRKRRAPGAAAHPFACTLEPLQEAIEIAAGELLSADADPIEVELSLPTAGGTPLPSPGALPEVGAALPRPAEGLQTWRVHGWALAAEDALDLLLLLDRVETPAVPDVALGDSLRFWIGVAKLALEQVATGQMLPSLERHDGAFVAAWRPLPAALADARVGALVEAMPPVCRAEVDADTSAGRDREGDGHHAGASARAIFADAFDHLLDAAAWQALAGVALVPPRRGRVTGRISPAEAWLAALAGDDPLVDADEERLARFKEDLDRWLAPAAATTRHPSVRTCFRLTPPRDTATPVALAPGSTTADSPAAPDSSIERAAAAAPEDRWRIDLLLQSTDDPSLLIPADEVWRTRSSALRVLRHTIDEPQEALLADLGRAWRIFPDLEPALRTARPTGFALDTAGAHRFLRQAAPILEQSGFGVLVPSWWKKPSARLGAKLVTRPKSDNGSASGLLGLDGICAYEWQVALGDETLDLAELQALAALKVPLVRMRGEWVEVDQEQIETALALVGDGAHQGEMTVSQALRLAVGAEQAPGDLPVTGVETHGWLADLLAPGRNGESRIHSAATPESFRGTLRPYQERGLGWLDFLDRLGVGACLADDMGLGKTPQTLALLAATRAREDSVGTAPAAAPTLLICPMSVVGNWQREAARFTPDLRVHVHHGAERASGDDFRDAVADSDLVITTYALAARDREELAALEWGRIVLDEAQNIKNAAAQQTQAIRSFQSPRRLALTGTPVENRLSELWSILDFLNPGLLGSAAAFKRSFTTPIERYHDADRAELLRRVTGPFILRRLKTDRSIIDDLPEKVEMKVFCNLTREQASLYQATIDEMLERIETSEGIERKGLVLSTMLKLKQVCNHPAQLLGDQSRIDGRSGKLERLEETLEEVLSVGDRALVFTQFAEMGRILQAHLRARFGREVLYLHGGTRKKQRDEMVARFQAPDGPQIFLLSLKAGGTGLNLTAANHVIHFDRWWNPAVEDQATDRAYRIGQTRGVQVRKLVCAGTLEERIDQMIEQKKALAERIVGTGEAWLTELSTADLRDLVRLSADAVAE